jgi:hypothetical protein
MGDETPATSTAAVASTTAASSTSATNSLFDLIDTPAPAAVPAPQRNGAVMHGGAGGLDDLLSGLGGVGLTQQAQAPTPKTSAFSVYAQRMSHNAHCRCMQCRLGLCALDA